jgi:protein involved in polysaccharide export with SLBB domain
MDRSIKLFINKRVALSFMLATLFFVSSYSQAPVTSSPQSINDLLQNNNINPSQINQTNAKAYFQDNNKAQNQEGEDKNTGLSDQKNKPGNRALGRDSTQKDNFKENAYSPDQTYGAYVFQEAAITDVSELSTPPLDYPIGVGDHIVVALWGGGEYQEDYVVARDGSIFPSGLGKIIVQGLTFEAARALIYSRFKSVVPASTNIEITLGQPRTINVNVGGEVVDPGPLTVSAFSNAFNVIGLAGGVTDFGNLREIQVKRDGKIIEVLDVYKYLTSGDIGHHIYLQNNDFILVKFVEKKVFATGQFKRPMYYQLKKDEGIKALIDYSGGFTSDALTSAIKVIRTENEKQVIHNVNATSIIRQSTDQDYLLADGDIIKADLVKPGIINKVEIKGAAAYPGIYELKTNDRLFDVINRAGGITKNTYLSRAYVFRGAGDSTNIKPDRLELDISSINNAGGNSDPNNILLQANDVIQLFTDNEFSDQQYVEIYGEVRKEGQVIKYGGMTLQDLLYLSGGIKPSAEYGRLEISSIVDIDSAQKGLKPTRTVVKSYAILPNLELDTIASKIILKPYDQIFVRKNPTFELQENVQLLGLVKYPGFYPRLSTNERLSSYIERAGGIRENANIDGAILYRKKTDLFRETIVNNSSKPKLDSNGHVIRDSALDILEEPISIDLYKAVKYKNSEQDIILQQNDILFVPEINPFVTIKGKVQSPLRITFDKSHTNLGYYIDKAGGLGIHPWRKRIYVTYANGKSRRTRNFFFAHFYPKVEEGSTVTVPERPEAKEFSDALVQSVTAIIPIAVAAVLVKIL